MDAALDKTGVSRVLFVAEAVTLAHVARPLVLANSLEQSGYEVHFAHHPRYQKLLGQLAFSEHAIDSISTQQFSAALSSGAPLYDFEQLKSYVEDDLRLLSEVQPQVVVGDFRLSLAVSARLAGVPYVTISNAYWSPYGQPTYTVPELPLTRVLGPRIGQRLFNLGRPVAFALHCLPMRRLRRYFGQPSLGWDLREVYTHADLTLYADVPQFYPQLQLPDHHRFIGPIDWSPQIALPDWWEKLSGDKPCVYVTLGSSGSTDLLPTLIQALGGLDIEAVVSTAGAQLSGPLPENVHTAAYLPGERAVSRADLVICNGGSPTVGQALLAGVPVLGLAGNLDQYLNMSVIVERGAGRLLRSGQATVRHLEHSIGELLESSRYREQAVACQSALKRYDAGSHFLKIVNTL